MVSQEAKKEPLCLQLLQNGFLIGFPLCSRATHYPTTGSASHRGPAREGLTTPHHTNVGAGADGALAFTLVSFLNLLTSMLHVLHAFSGHIGLSKLLEGSSYGRSFLDPVKDGVTSGPQPVSGLGKAFGLQHQGSAWCPVRPLPDL